MFLILHHQDIQTLTFINYCKKKKLEFLALPMSKFIKETKVNSYLSNDNFFNELIFQENNIQIEHISGIYNQSYYPEEDLFNQFILEDRYYARTEWHSYILYLLATHQNCLNPVNYKQFVGINLSLSNIYALCEKFGFRAPKYEFLLPHISKEYIQSLIDNNYIFKMSAYDYVNYHSEMFDKKPLMAIQMQKGAQLICVVIKNQVFAKIRFLEEDKLIELDENIKNQCLLLVQSLELKIAEIFLMFTPNQEYFCYHVSPYPNWSLFGDDQYLLWDQLILSLQE